MKTSHPIKHDKRNVAKRGLLHYRKQQHLFTELLWRQIRREIQRTKTYKTPVYLPVGDAPTKSYTALFDKLADVVFGWGVYFAGVFALLFALSDSAVAHVVSGHVTTQNPSTVNKRAKIEFTNVTTGAKITTFSDADGNYAKDISAGLYTVRVFGDKSYKFTKKKSTASLSDSLNDTVNVNNNLFVNFKLVDSINTVDNLSKYFEIY